MSSLLFFPCQRQGSHRVVVTPYEISIGRMMYVYGYVYIMCVLSNVKSSDVNLSYQSIKTNQLISQIIHPANPPTNPRTALASQPLRQRLRLPASSLQCLPTWVGMRRSQPLAPSVARLPPPFYLAAAAAARAGLRFARWGLAAASPLVPSHGLADRSPLPTLPHKPPRRPLGVLSSLPIRDAPCHLCALGTASGA